MAFIPVPNTVRAVIEYVCHGQPCANIVHWTKATPGTVTPADVQTVATNVLNWWVGSMAAHISTDVQIIQVVGTAIDVPSGAQFIAVPGTPHFGTAAGAAVPNNVSYAIKFTTGLSGRSYRGRFYVLGMLATTVTGNTISSASGAAFVTAVAALGTDATAVSFVHTVVSLVNGGAPRVTGVATPITTYSFTDLVVDTQRRRLN